MRTLILCRRSRGGATTDAEAPADTGEHCGDSTVHVVRGGSGNHDSCIPQTEDQEVLQFYDNECYTLTEIVGPDALTERCMRVFTGRR